MKRKAFFFFTVVLPDRVIGTARNFGEAREWREKHPGSWYRIRIFWCRCGECTEFLDC